MSSEESHELARGIPVPYEWDRVLGPELVYGEGPTALYCLTEEDEHVRITFERLDAIRACRGEYLPYEDDWTGERYPQLFIVENSRWLRERYEYEARHYRDCYEFGGDVNEMLTDYDHYLFRFHDEFIEAVAAGLWFEKQANRFDGNTLPPDHPSQDLPSSATTDQFAVDDIICQIRTNSKPIEEIVQAAFYCSQPLYHFAMELDGSAKVSYRLDLRARGGITQSRLQGSMGTPLSTVPGRATLEQARELVEPLVRQVSERRRQMWDER
jgi:hypothetical protein